MNIFLFHRDLRIQDNTALIYQLQELKEEIIPIFIFPPEQINQENNKYFSHNCVQFMIESLHELSESIKAKKGKLYFFKGDTIEVLKSLHKKNTINSIAYIIRNGVPVAKPQVETSDSAGSVIFGTLFGIGLVIVFFWIISILFR